MRKYYCLRQENGEESEKFYYGINEFLSKPEALKKIKNLKLDLVSNHIDCEIISGEEVVVKNI
jgi:hypothetical protein